MEEKIRPFSNGFEFEEWLHKNCLHFCIFYTSKPTCEIEKEVASACFSDGKILKKTYEKIKNGCKNFKAVENGRE